MAYSSENAISVAVAEMVPLFLNPLLSMMGGPAVARSADGIRATSLSRYALATAARDRPGPRHPTARRPGGNLSTALLSVAGQIHQLDGSAEVFLPENATVLSATS
jgi:hypothetical protein